MKHEGWSFAERWFLWYGMIATNLLDIRDETGGRA